MTYTCLYNFWAYQMLDNRRNGGVAGKSGCFDKVVTCKSGCFNKVVTCNSGCFNKIIPLTNIYSYSNKQGTRSSNQH